MKLLWQSDARRSPGGYGNQTNLFVPALKKAGHDPAIFAFWGCEGSPQVDEDGIVTLPRLRDHYGNDIIDAHMAHVQAELLITLIDPWVLDPTVYGKLPWCSYAPIDSAPVRPENVESLRAARWIWAMSRFGEEQLHAAGLENVTYVPHGVDTEVFKPISRDEARARLGKALGVDLAGKYLIVMNAANKGMPSRKGFSEALEAFKAFSEERPDTLLYIHTEPFGVWGGEHLPTMVESLKLDPTRVLYPNHYRYITGMLPAKYLNDVYNAGDVLLSPSHGEGFGIPIVEAQAAGCPVIVTDFSAMSELVFSGHAVPGTRMWMLPGMQWCIPSISSLIWSLGIFYRDRNGEAPRNQARAGALQYDYRRVFSEYMLPAVDRMAREIQRDKESLRIVEIPARSRYASPEPGSPIKFTTSLNTTCQVNGHDWALTGVYDGGDLCVPCRRKGCAAELRIDSRTGQQHINPTGFETVIDGITLDLEDDPEGGVTKIVCREASTSYGLASIPFEDGDVVIDIGAHVGVISIYLAKKYPGIKIFAFEPVPENFQRLKRNLEANHVSNVVAANLAVTGDGRDLILTGNPEQNSGGISAFAGGGRTFHAVSTTLREIMSGFERCKLLKIDCEGAEYEILYHDYPLLDRIDYLCGEFHESSVLRARLYAAERLLALCAEYIPQDHIRVHTCQIAEPAELTPDVSLLVPTWNIESYGVDKVWRMVASALDQKGVRVEVILCNDASTDDTENIIRDWARWDYRIRVINRAENGGAMMSCNDAAAVATGRYFIEGSCRSWFEPGAFAALVKALDENASVGFAYGATQYHGVQNHLHTPPPFRAEDFYTSFPSLQAYMYRREAWDKGCRHYRDCQIDGKWVYPGDWDFAMQMIVNLGWQGYTLNTLVYHYIMDASGQQTHIFEANREQIMKVFNARWPKVTV
jgi:FkbM family methyltransferase